MQTYPLALAASNNFGTRISSLGSQIVFESGTSTGDSHIRVKTDTGDDIELKPGQQVRFVKPVTQWYVSSLDGTSAINGKLIIGDGDFTDSNISNTFTLDSTFANTVKLNNTTAERVPVTLDVTQELKIKGGIVAYTKAYSSSAESAVQTGIQLLSAAENVAGAILHKFEIITRLTVAYQYSILAKATAPANIADGDILFSEVLTGAQLMTKSKMDMGKDGQIQVPAGKAIWYFTTNLDSCLLRSALFTVL